MRPLPRHHPTQTHRCRSLRSSCSSFPGTHWLQTVSQAGSPPFSGSPCPPGHSLSPSTREGRVEWASQPPGPHPSPLLEPGHGLNRRWMSRAVLGLGLERIHLLPALLSWTLSDSGNCTKLDVLLQWQHTRFPIHQTVGRRPQ